MAKLKPLQIKPRRESSAGKWIFILILFAAAAGAYVKRDLISEKVHTLVHGEQPADPSPIPVAPAMMAPSAPVVAPVSTPDNPCGAFANDAAQMSICLSQQQKIKRMQEDAKARDKAFETPPPKPAGGQQQPGTSTTGP